MLQTFEAVIDEQGRVRLLEPLALPGPRRALVTILDEPLVAAGPLDDGWMDANRQIEGEGRPEDKAPDIILPAERQVATPFNDPLFEGLLPF
ncbi:hypothetical protein [Candidatus Amarolinea aalborgensis]|mgnify:CR=1 FL=1|jgi:hypothetical protein|uniref:hypothetical protein n=1 Tax=Candidatus Amarolinea aalborgensis TaxID=2249329 RepID=UPI003BFA1A51